MKRQSLTRRQALALGAVGVAGPFVATRRAAAQPAPETVVYVSNAGSKEIGVFAMNRDSGELAAIDKAAVPGTNKPSPSSMPMAVTPDHRFLFAALRSDNFPASSFAIDHATGRLSHLATTPLTASMAYLSTDRTGHWLLAASYPGNQLSINPIDGDGHIVEKPTQIVPNRPKSHCILVDAANKYCYATSLGADIVMEWKFDPATGTLAPNGPGAVHTKPGAGPRHMALHPNRRFLYLITETTATIGAYAIDPASGTLTELQFVDARPPGFTAQPAAADLHVTPDGRFLYGSERKTSTLA
ncbi:MAG: lactonase family protein, partial [Stellaceae bacterium]